MDEMTAVTIGAQAIKVALLVGLPMLLAGMVVGILVSIFQVATSIQDVTITFIPKILAVFTALVLSLHWMLRVLLEFTTQIFGMVSQLGA
jgi:flagellar biosynthetic protein FliQ